MTQKEIDKHNITMRQIKRGTYRMKVRQNGGKFIEVTDYNDLLKVEYMERKEEFAKIMEDRDMGYSGYDEDHNVTIIDDTVSMERTMA